MLTFFGPSVRLTAFTVTMILAGVSISRAADPGIAIAETSEASDQKSGSLLIYNLFSSGLTSAEDTRISLTNNSATDAAFVRLFFVNGSTGFVTDNSVCLTAQQTISFKASAVRPGQTGYLVAVAIDGVTGQPADLNSLSGQAQVRLASGHTGTLPAVAYAKQNATNVISTDGSLAALFFDGLNLSGSYNRAARVLQISDIPSRSDVTSTLVVLNRLGGNLAGTANTVGTLDGVLFNDAEDSSGFSTPVNAPQLKVELTDSFPVTAPTFSTMIPAGRTGWMKFFSQSDIGLSGSVLYMGSSSSTSGGGGKGNVKVTTTTFSNGGVNMRALSLSAAANYVIPVRGPSCN